MHIVPKNIESYKIYASNKVTTLNPNAAEFVPSALRSRSGKSMLDRSESSISNISNNSDDEAHQYWRHQLPDDITPDFKVIGEDDMFNLAGLSVGDGIEPSRFSTSMVLETFGTQQGRMKGKQYSGKSSASFVNGILGGQDVIDAAALDPVEFLTSQFPSFSAENLADMYYANGCDLNFTIEVLRHLELQGDGGFKQNPNSKTESHSRLSKYTQDLHKVSDTWNLFQNARKFSPLDTSLWKHERNGSADGHGKLLYGDKVARPGASQIAPLWLETGEAVENIHSESREEARPLSHLRDACLEQASQAYLLGNKNLARELSEKGHLCNMQLKTAQMKARKRDPVPYELPGYNRGGQERLINLHRLHMSDALHVLKHELDVLRSSTSRAQATIFVGTGKSASFSPRLPMAVEQFLLEQGLTYTQPQPGLLHVVTY